MNPIVPEFVNLFCSGLLAGIEFIVFFGVRTSLQVLSAEPQIQIRQVLMAMTGITVVVLRGTAPGFLCRCAGMLAVLTWALVTFAGTVPINEALLTWRPDALPENWRAVIKRWERLDMIRTWAALTAFACLLVAVAMRLGIAIER
jgi:uncharacterized membrane protein